MTKYILQTSRVHPGLYPILTLLSRLQPSTVDSDAQRDSLSAITPLVLSCSRSTIYKVFFYAFYQNGYRDPANTLL